MKISRLFHWLYAILMFLPFMAIAFNFVRFSFSGTISITGYEDIIALVKFPNWDAVSSSVYNVYSYLWSNVFGIGFANGIGSFILNSLTYWTIISIVYLIFDVFMYVPLLVHRWIDKARLE